jgi:CheY-like chemotaxis protein
MNHAAGAGGEVSTYAVTNNDHRVLVIEDDPALREIYAGSLSEHGHSVRSAGNGSEALERLEDGWTPCVIFLDLRMPGMDGWEFARQLRSDTRLEALPIVVVAAHFRIDQEAREIGAAAWLQKPFDLSRLDEQIDSLCHDKIEGSAAPG